MEVELEARAMACFMISRRTPLRGVVLAAMPRLLSPNPPDEKGEEERDGVGGRPRRESTWRMLQPPEVCSNRSGCRSSAQGREVLSTQGREMTDRPLEVEERRDLRPATSLRSRMGIRLCCCQATTTTPVRLLHCPVAMAVTGGRF